MIVEFEGERHEFPDDASQQDIAKALAGHSKQPMSQVLAGLQGVKQGMSAGFADEIQGARAASGVGPALESVAPGYGGQAVRAVVQSLPYEPMIETAIGAARTGYERLTGQDGQATRDYVAARDAERTLDKQAAADFPKTRIAGEVGGALALPVARGAPAATLPARMARAAKVGAGIGAATGVGESEGDLVDTAIQAGVRGIAGGALGAVGAPIAEGIARIAAPAIAKVTGPIANTIRGALNPREEAARQVVTAIERDIKADPKGLSRLTPTEFAQGVAEGQPVAAMDIGGGLTRRLADVASITSPEAATTLQSAINPRFESQSPRLAGWLRQTFNYPDAAAQQEAISQAAGTANKAAYARAYSDPAARGIWNPTFEQIAQAPEVQAAIRKVLPKSASQAAREGFTPIRNPFSFDANGRMTLQGNARPDLQFWDQVKRQLDKGDWSSREWSRILRGELDQIVPSYQAARAGASHFFGAENALEAGQNFVGASQRYGIPATRRALSQMSQQERQLFQDGYVSRLVEKIEATGDRRSVLNSISQSPAAREEMRLALGPQRAAEVEARLRVEGIMDLVRGAVSGNSWTARRLYDVGLAGGAGIGLGELTLHNDPKTAAVAGIVAALAGGGKKINTNVMRHVAELLVSNDLGQLAKGVKIVAGNGRLLDALRATDRRLAAISAEQAPNPPAIQAGGVSSAQPNQNNVPRPPSQ